MCNGSSTKGVKTIFHPCVFYEHQETSDAQNHFNCPIVVSYPENLKNNVEAAAGRGGALSQALSWPSLSEKTVADRLAARSAAKQWGISRRRRRGWRFHACLGRAAKGQGGYPRRGRAGARKNAAGTGGRGVVLAGRPYHLDPEINHGIPELIASYGLDVLTEDSLPIDFTPERPLRANDQWVYHSRLYTAAEFVRRCDDLELIQLNSFGCGLDAVTTDQVSEILEGSNKLYTVLKIDEVNNLGAVRIRIRSLLAAMRIAT